jgi:hypothetical protein
MRLKNPHPTHYQTNMKKLLLILSLLAFTSCVAVGPRCTYTQEGTKISSWIWFTKEIPVDLSKDNCN